MLANQAILIVDHEAPDFGPLVSSIPTCLLPVAGRPVLVHALDELCALGVKNVFIVMSAFPEQIREVLADGHRWGLDVKYVLTRGDATEEEILERCLWDRSQPLIIARGDRVRGGASKYFDQRMEDAKHLARWDAFDGQGTDLGLAFLRPKSIGRQRMLIEDCSVGRIDTPEDLLKANMEALDGILPVDGHIVTERDEFHAGNGVQVHEKANIIGKVLAGALCQISEGVTIGPHAVLGRRVFVDEGATITNSLVLAETYVGRGVHLDGVIADANHVIEIASMRTEESRNEALLSSMAPSRMSDGIEGIIHRTIALALWLITLPLWPLLLLGSILENPKHPFSSRQILGNRRKAGRRLPFRVWIPALRMRIFISLPRLWSVVRGNLRLVGVTPELLPDPTRPMDEDAPWLEVLDHAPAGMISPGRISASDDKIEKQLTDAIYVQKRNPLRDLMLLLKSPFCAAS